MLASFSAAADHLFSHRCTLGQRKNYRRPRVMPGARLDFQDIAYQKRAPPPKQGNK
jgi:hypothetical protein